MHFPWFHKFPHISILLSVKKLVTLFTSVVFQDAFLFLSFCWCSDLHLSTQLPYVWFFFYRSCLLRRALDSWSQMDFIWFFVCWISCITSLLYIVSTHYIYILFPVVMFQWESMRYHFGLEIWNLSLSRWPLYQVVKVLAQKCNYLICTFSSVLFLVHNLHITIQQVMFQPQISVLPAVLLSSA